MLQSLARIRDPRTARNSGKVESHPRRAASVIRALPPQPRRDRRRRMPVRPRSCLAEPPIRHQLQPAQGRVLRFRSRLAPEPRISRPGYMGRSWWTVRPSGPKHSRDDARNNNARMHWGLVCALTLRRPRNATLRKPDRRPERAEAQ